MSKLVIVESPSKIKTVKKTLGSDYNVMASKGHVRDLPKSKFGIDIEHGFEPKYINMPDKKELIKELQYAAANSDCVYLATDPDREGEAISWHLAQLLSLSLNDANRVSFNEITESGIKAGMASPRKIDMNLVDAQQARRVLDRIVGYNLSPFLWKKVKSGLSAGRVQTVALRLIVDREKEIEAFVPVEYWTIDAKLQASRKNFSASFYGLGDGTKVEIANKEQADKILSDLDGASYLVSKIKKGVRNKQPAAPFITATLQQEASRKLGFTGQKTMRVAQNLYEGVEIDGAGSTGLITYMRTDSLRISDEARAAGNAYILNKYGEKYLPKSARVYKSKTAVQDAHEAIRPTNVNFTPESVKSSLTTDQYKIYKLIWERFIASQMSNAVYKTLNAEFDANGITFRASGSALTFAGYRALYIEGSE
ncbi:MAG: type I DNA topoisomerase, partial [Acutalibacteraceae bacterium]|nr:type I DNA topoisomerase [Acutalibacteraceae bacterium]